MKWCDYREKLGIGFSDKDKAVKLKNKIDLYLSHYLKFYYTHFSEFDNLCRDYYISIGERPITTSRFKIYELVNNICLYDSISEIISRYIALTISFSKFLGNQQALVLIDKLKYFLSELNLKYRIFEDDDGIYLFPEGAKELDDALVSEPLEWLHDYPKTYESFTLALREYSNGAFERNTADNLRKALESFLQEVLGNNKNLEKNKNEICHHLGEKNADPTVIGLFKQVINIYKNFNDENVKHNNNLDPRLLEFLLYQTGLLIRMVIVIEKS